MAPAGSTPVRPVPRCIFPLPDASEGRGRLAPGRSWRPDGRRVSRRATRVSIRLPAALLERARQEAAQCGVSVREFVSQAAHGALAERLRQHATRAAEQPAAPTEPGEDD
jgi:hypothetical protein